MKYARISLINPPLDDHVKVCVDTGHWFPLNLMALASYLKENGFNGDIQILDHQVLDKQEIVERLVDFRPDLVGLSPNMDSYQQCLSLAKMIKSIYDSDIVLGGSYATELAHNILLNRDYIDVVIKRDGEIALKELVDGRKLREISNLTFRHGSEIIENEIQYHLPASHCKMDYSLIDMEPYFRNYANSIHPGGLRKPAAFLSQRGCVWREQSGGCIFCSRIEPFARFDRPENVWLQLQELRKQYGIDSILEVSDDFLGNLNWFDNFYDCRPDDMRDFSLRFIYARVNNITPHRADMLKQLNTKEICLGIESGDKGILKNSTKGSSPAQQLRAISLLEEKEIGLIISMLFGLPGESESSIQQSYQHIEQILMKSNINELVVSAMIPLPGSEAYRMLMASSHLMREKYQALDTIPIREMQKDWVETFCHVDFGTVMNYIEKINKLSDKSYVEMY